MPLNLHASPSPLLWHEKQNGIKQLTCQTLQLRHTKGGFVASTSIKKITKKLPKLHWKCFSTVSKGVCKTINFCYAVSASSCRSSFCQWLIPEFCSWKCLLTEKFGDLRETRNSRALTLVSRSANSTVYFLPMFKWKAWALWSLQILKVYYIPLQVCW